MRIKRTLRTTLTATALAGLMATGAASASAHVHVTPDTAGAGSSALLTFDLSHGCNESPTTRLAFTLPEELNDATPTANPNWTITKVEQKLPAPKKLADGTTITKRVSQIVYTAKTPLTSGVRDAFTLSVDLPDAQGSSLSFPLLQTCEKGQTNWNQIPKPGQSDESMTAPAPTLTLTQAVASGADHSGADHAGSIAAAAGSNTQAESAGSTDTGAAVAGYVGLGAGILGLAAGLWALARTRKTQVKN